MRIAGWSCGSSEAWLFVLSAVAIVGSSMWILLPGDAESQSTAPASAIVRVSGNASGLDAVPIETGRGGSVPSAVLANANPAAVDAAPLDIAPPETIPAKPPVDGLKISSQSWRRGGLGSKALVTFTLRNRNDYAVKDIEIVCTFAGRDGRHLTDRRRVIPGTVKMKSRKRYTRLLVGFVNVEANKAKCSLVTADRN